MSIQGLNEFNRQLDQYAKQLLPRQISDFHRKIVLEALRRIVQKTPVDTGRAKGNWQVTINSPASGQLNTIDKSGGRTIAQAMAAISDFPPFSVVYITNNIDYIEFLEEGSSKQAPAGMVGLTVQELMTMFTGYKA